MLGKKTFDQKIVQPVKDTAVTAIVALCVALLALLVSAARLVRH